MALMALCLPGTALYMGGAWLFWGRKGTQLALCSALLPGIGLSVAFWPLLLLYLSLLGVGFSAALLWLVLAISLAVIIVLWAILARRARPTRDEVIAGGGLAGMMLLALAFRLGDINGLAVPMFGDSLHHTMITSIIASSGKVPQGYQPYVPVDTFTYHFGFHTLAAILSLLTGLAIPAAVLIMGQALIVMSLPVAYLLTRQLFSSRVAGLAAAMITGFVSVMPAYYINWGRYTQLSGLVLLPVAATLLLRAVARRGKSYETGLAAFCVAGLVVVHYRILIFYGLFVVAMAAWYTITKWRDRSALMSAAVRVITTTGVGLLLAAPWLWNLAVNYFPSLSRRLSTVSPDYIAIYNSTENFTRFVGILVAALGVLGLWLALWSPLARQPAKANENTETVGDAGIMPPHLAVYGVATWIALMLVGLWVPPGALGSLSVATALYLPLSVLGGYGIARLANMPAVRASIPAWGVPVALFLAAPLVALTLRTWHVADPDSNSYVRNGDLQAFDWIKENTPATAKFLISSQISYAGRAVTASDAGMWLPVLVGRSVSVPALAAWTERPLQPDYFEQARTLAAYTQPTNDPTIQGLAAKSSIPPPRNPSDPMLLDQMRKMGITHVYSGTPGGASQPRLDVASMRRDSCHYKLIRPPEDGIYIFEINYNCP